MEVKYVNSNNDSISFFGSKIKACNGTFHQRKWSVSDGNIYKDAITYKLTITLRGTLDERKAMLNHLFEIFEYDLENQSKGTIYVDDYHIKCNVVSSEESINSINNSRTDVNIEIYCESQNWIRETTYSLSAGVEQRDVVNSKLYEYRYPYVYSSQKDVINIDNQSVAKADVIIRMFGPCINPFVKIGDIVYQINSSLENGEYFEIETENRTIYKVSRFGDKTNAMMYRSKERGEFFEKIPQGVSVASWGGSYKAEITVVEKRSEPRWS